RTWRAAPPLRARPASRSLPGPGPSPGLTLTRPERGGPGGAARAQLGGTGAKRRHRNPEDRATMNGPAPDLVASAPARHYDALDLLRGCAAMVVVLYHVAFLFVDDRVMFESGFLCVDMFFMLSGFVIAANY